MLRSLRRLGLGAQGVSLAFCAALGAIAGVLFASGSEWAWRAAFATNLWVLIAGLAVVLLKLANAHIVHWDWTDRLAHGAAVFLPNAACYLLALLLIAAPGLPRVFNGRELLTFEDLVLRVGLSSILSGAALAFVFVLLTRRLVHAPRRR